jgi:hypothetical protein
MKIYTNNGNCPLKDIAKSGYKPIYEIQIKTSIYTYGYKLKNQRDQEKTNALITNANGIF